jgi:hypothetical protein
MELIFENWRKALNEAAREPKDLVNISDKIKDVWIDNLLDEYDLNELISFYQIPVSRKFQVYYNKIKQNPTPEQKKQIKNYTIKFRQAMERHGAAAPKPIIIIAPGRSGNNSYKVSYGGFFTRVKTGTVQVVSFDTGKRADNKNGIKGFPGGSIKFSPVNFYHPSHGSADCDDGFAIDGTFDTTKGWGPMLYHVAVEVASIKGNGLTSDRNLVSGRAKPIWDFFLKNKPDGVKASQLDIKGDEAKEFGLKQLTKTKKDDCGQRSSVSWALGSEYGDWHRDDKQDPFDGMDAMSDEAKEDFPWFDQSISKLYSKSSNIIRILGEEGLLHAPEFGYDLVKSAAPPEDDPFPEDELPPPPPLPANESISRRVKVKVIK